MTTLDKEQLQIKPKTVREQLILDVIREHYGRPLGVKEIAKEVPELYHLIQFSPWLGFQEKIDREWRDIAELTAIMIEVAREILDTFPSKMMEKHQNAENSLTREEIVSAIIRDDIDYLWNDWKSTLIAQLPKVKVWKERQAETFYEQGLMAPEPKKEKVETLSQVKQRGDQYDV